MLPAIGFGRSKNSSRRHKLGGMRVRVFAIILRRQTYLGVNTIPRPTFSEVLRAGA
jgi:hypothetical protein